jgi:hypothetical protein
VPNSIVDALFERNCTVSFSFIPIFSSADMILGATERLTEPTR